MRMRTYTVDVVTVAPSFMVALGLLPATERKTITVRGYSLEDAKRRAGIE